MPTLSDTNICSYGPRKELREMGLIFEPTTSPLRGWTVHRAATGELLGSVEWHDQLGVYGFAARPGLALTFDGRALEAIGHFVDEANSK